MAIGDEGEAAGYGKVPDTGEDGKVKWGAREINRTRDFLAQLKALVPGNKAAARAAAGITSSNSVPGAGVGNDGDIHFRTP
jgi:hypothetical protein